GVSQQIYSLPHLATLVFARAASRFPKDYSLNHISSWAYLETAAKLGNNSNPQNKSAIYFVPFPEKDLPYSSSP
uniref:hypothetical protein n=1 Tax=Alloprevotella tannerae TaxID=76122 RepID=UPI0028E19ED2